MNSTANAHPTHRRFDARNQHFVGQEGRLIPLLQEAQARDGYLTRDAIARIHEETGVPPAQIYGVATFYAQFRLSPAGKHIVRICHGTACHVSNAIEVTEAIEDHLQIKCGETTPDRFYTLEKVSCLGCCSLAPAMMIDSTTYGKLTARSAVETLKKFAAEANADTREAKG